VRSSHTMRMKFALSYLDSEYEHSSPKVVAGGLVKAGLMAAPKKGLTNNRSKKMLETFYNRKNKQLKKKTKPKKKKREGFLFSWEWTTLRYKILNKYGRRCMCCGASPDDGSTVLNVDHIKPRHTHPELSLDPDNLQVLCHPCNKGKGAWDDRDFRQE